MPCTPERGGFLAKGDYGVFVMKRRIMQSRQQSAVFDALYTAALCADAGWMQCGAKVSSTHDDAPPAFKESLPSSRMPMGGLLRQPQDGALRGKWWEIYNEPELNSLEDQLNIDNQNIQQAFENFMEARAWCARCGRSISQQQVLGAPTRERSRLPMLDLRPPPPHQAQSRRRCFSIPAGVSWSPTSGTKSATQCAPANTNANCPRPTLRMND